MLNQSELADNLRDITSRVEIVMTHAGFPDRIADTQVLLKAGEFRLAFENLCSNLYEFDCTIPSEAYSLMTIAGKSMGLADDVWKRLESQVCPD